MRIAYITAGAAGMYCGSCMHDNTLVVALRQLGHDALLIPTYTPIRTDEPDASQPRVFFGGINVFLQQKLSFFRHTPRIFDRLLDAPRLLRWAGRFASKTRAEELGDLTISMLKGERGYQRKEVVQIAEWLEDLRPDIIILSNVLLSGMVHEIGRRINVPMLCMLQGDDIFLEALPQAAREQVLELIRAHASEIQGYLTTSRFYADFMSGYLGIDRARMHVVYPGLNLDGHDGLPGARQPLPFTIGFFARICPEKGLHNLTEAYRILRQQSGTPPCRLRIAGWLGDHNKPYLQDLLKKLADAGLADEVEQVDCPDHKSKVEFLKSVDVLSVPTTYREPKGLYVLEAWANGVPVVQPRHGSFPELIEATGGGELCHVDDPHDLARVLGELRDNPTRRLELGQRGHEGVRRHFHAARMAQETATVFERYVKRG
ncbi:MAG TPA: glycosyltransferase [Gemmataceae bacterium]|jgi:glycosyltransferase involved in cell wall biosynthesis|nr:glycosyltransferase [Gemmataceae bacterium]